MIEVFKDIIYALFGLLILIFWVSGRLFYSPMLISIGNKLEDFQEAKLYY